MDNAALIQALITALGVIVGAIPPSIIAYAALQQGKRNGEAAVTTNDMVKKNDEKTDSISHRADEIVKQTGEIHELTNSNLTKVKEELAATKQELKDMRAVIAGLSEGKAGKSDPVEVAEQIETISEVTADTQERVKVIETEVTKK